MPGATLFWTAVRQKSPVPGNPYTLAEIAELGRSERPARLRTSGSPAQRGPWRRCNVHSETTGRDWNSRSHLGPQS